MSDGRLRVLRPVPDAEPRLEFQTVHGYRRAYRIVGEGPVVLLLHGIGDNSTTWSEIIPHLARRHTVIAPDLLGHGCSDKPRADYSIAAYANGMRDLLTVLGVERATVIGHSLGGGVAMQFSYQFPQMVERLVLVGAGGVTRDVNPLLRLASLPVTAQLLQLLKVPGVLPALKVFGTALLRVNPYFHDTPDLVRVVADLPDDTSRAAFLRTLRSVVDWRGQVVTALDRCYLSHEIPCQIIWGDRDSVIPVAHARLVHSAMPGSRLEVFSRAGHFPFHDDPMRFLHVVEEFVDSTAPYQHDPARWRKVLKEGAVPNITAGQGHDEVMEALVADERSAT